MNAVPRATWRALTKRRNYDAGGSCDDGSCTYPELYFECDGSAPTTPTVTGCAMSWKSSDAKTRMPATTTQPRPIQGNVSMPSSTTIATELPEDTDGDGVCDELESPVARTTRHATTILRPPRQTMAHANTRRSTTTVRATASWTRTAMACATNSKSTAARTAQRATMMPRPPRTMTLASTPRNTTIVQATA